MTNSFVLLADHMFVTVDGVRKHFRRGDELPPIDTPADVARLTRAKAIAPKGTPVGPKGLTIPPGSVLPGQPPAAAAAPSQPSGPQPDDDADDGDAGAGDGVERPKQVAPIAAWRAWAKAAGYDPAEVDEATKKDLMALK